MDLNTYLQFLQQGDIIQVDTFVYAFPFPGVNGHRFFFSHCYVNEKKLLYVVERSYIENLNYVVVYEYLGSKGSCIYDKKTIKSIFAGKLNRRNQDIRYPEWVNGF